MAEITTHPVEERGPSALPGPIGPLRTPMRREWWDPQDPECKIGQRFVAAHGLEDMQDGPSLDCLQRRQLARVVAPEVGHDEADRRVGNVQAGRKAIVFPKVGIDFLNRWKISSIIS